MNIENKYFMPAEWQEHEKSFVSWPVRSSMIWEENYEEVCNGYAEVINAILEFELVTVIVNDDTMDTAKAICSDKADFLSIPHNDAWIRDNGPTFIYDNHINLYGVNWKFNAWGEKYKPYDLDDHVAGRVLKYYNIPQINSPIVLEGGSIHVDGEGTLLTTEQCLLNKNRNPVLSRDDIENEVKMRLGIKKVIWLKYGLFGDETDGHIDNIACFAKPGVILLQTCYDKNDQNFDITRENIEILSKATDANGRKLDIIEIEQPPIRFYNGIRLTLSYLNFYFVNGGIILPIFGGEAEDTDKKAIKVLQMTFPDRRIKTVDGMALIKEGGNVHCITQQMPKAWSRRET